MGRRAKSPKGKAETERAPIPKPPKNDGARVRDLEKRLAESLEQQSATSEILRVIGSSPTDAQPVFETIARSGVSVCAALGCAVFVVDGDVLRVAATHGVRPERLARFREQYPIPVSAEIDTAQTIRERRVFHLADIEHNPNATPSDIENARLAGYRTRLMVPMVCGDRAVGLIAVTRELPLAFSDQQVELLKTFAHQAVIAIENVRLFTETKEALEQETATAEILRVISQSPANVQPVFDAIVRSAATLCHAPDVIISIADRDALRLMASIGPVAASVRQSQIVRDGGLPLTRGSVSGRAFIDRRTIHVNDVSAMPDDDFPEGKALQRQYGGHGTTLAVPLLREDVALGVITLVRNEISPFTERQVALLESFANQAVIAIENVRLFTELRASNRELTTALDQQTATNDILKVISRSQTDVQPVFDAIADSALHLCEAKHGNVFLFDGALVHLAAVAGTDQEGTETVRRSFPQPPGLASATTRAILTHRPVIIPDVFEDREFELTEMVRVAGFRSVMSIPMLREGFPIGAITVTRAGAGPFSDTQVALLQTFADQAVIAIENVRLFNELEGRNRDLTATSEILRVISGVQTDAQPVFDTIVKSAVRLCKAASAAVFLADGQMLYEPANYGGSPEALAAARARYPRPLDMDTAGGIAVLTRSVVHVPDTEDSSAIEWIRQSGRLVGFRSMVTVPMLREGDAVGAILVTRRQPGPFSDIEVELLQTFADQAVIAIENVRLFRELQARTGELTRSVGELKALGEVGQAISSTLDLQTVLRTIVARATELAGVDAGVIYEYDEQDEVFVPRATEHLEAEIVETLTAAPVRRGEGVTGRLADAQEPIQLSDILEAPAESRIRDTLGRAGYRAGSWLCQWRRRALSSAWRQAHPSWP